MKPGEKSELQWEDEQKLATDNWKTIYGNGKTKHSSPKFIKMILSNFSKKMWQQVSVFINYVHMQGLAQIMPTYYKLFYYKIIGT